jgi:ABC-type multidrug transport system ATPase subunit
VIQLEKIGYTYRSIVGRSTRALDDLTLTANAGEVLGIAGPNGAGKTTLIGILLGYLIPTTGKASIAGVPPRRYVERNGIAYLSELVNMPKSWSVRSALRRYADLLDVPVADVEQSIERAIVRTGLEEHAHKRVKALSKGNVQRLGLAQALLKEQAVYIFDEPTHGLDPVWTARFRDIVRDLRRPGRVIVIASHNLDELQRIADRVAIINRGRLQRVVHTSARVGAERLAYRIVVEGAHHAVVTELFPMAIAVSESEYHINVALLDELNLGLAALLSRGVMLREVSEVQLSLEHHFHEAVSEARK